MKHHKVRLVTAALFFCLCLGVSFLAPATASAGSTCWMCTGAQTTCTACIAGRTICWVDEYNVCDLAGDRCSPFN